MAELNKNEIYEAVIDGYSSEGDGVARIDGRAVFVRGALDGERCRIRILKATKTAAWAKVEEMIVPSEHRIDPQCPAFPRCGGCSLRHMDYEEELRFKRKRVDDALCRIGGLDIRTEGIIGDDDVNGYRNKAIWNVERDAYGKPMLGFYREHSHDVVEAGRCAIVADYSNRAAAAVRKWMDEAGVGAYDEKTRTGVRRIFCRRGARSGEGQTVIVTGRGELPTDGLIAAVREACPETVSIMRNVNETVGNTVLSGSYETLWGKPYIEDTLCGLSFRIAPEAFYQVNSAQAELLYGKALEYSELNREKTVLDLYCGTGTITLYLARYAGEAAGAEIVREAVENAEANARANAAQNVRFICADAGEAAKRLAAEGFRADVITLDPPRKGLLPGTAETVAAMRPERVVYVSCDPATLARDLKIFAGLGYKTERACAVDLFPRTPHVECVATLVRADG